MSRVLAWFSAGAPSAVAVKLAQQKHGHNSVIPVRCSTGAEHLDNDRFEVECAQWFGRAVHVLKSEIYKDTWDVWERTRWLAGPKGARCTGELKVAPRLAFQKPYDIHVFGYTADVDDVRRASNLRSKYFELQIETPLIDAGLTKAACLALVAGAGISPPITYEIGLPNANCIPCVKATSPNYWALIRLRFPDVFCRMAELSRRLGVRLCRIKGERCFIDEIPDDWPVTSPVVPACDLMCAITDFEIQGVGA